SVTTIWITAGALPIPLAIVRKLTFEPTAASIPIPGLCPGYCRRVRKPRINQSRPLQLPQGKPPTVATRTRDTAPYGPLNHERIRDRPKSLPPHNFRPAYFYCSCART